MIVAGILDRAGDSLGASLPRIGGALVLAVLGLFLGWLFGRIVGRVLLSVGLDDLGERLGVHDVLERVGLERSLARLVGLAVRITISVVALVAAVSLLGFAALSQSLNEAVLFLPKLFVALLLVLAGVVVGDFVGDRIERLADQLDLGGPLGRIARLAVLALFVLTALAQLGIPTAILTAFVAVVIVAAALTVTLAFGLGSRDVARQISAGRYVRGAFEVGQTVSMDGWSGEIVALEGAATVLRTEDGRTLRVPNHLLLESVVVVSGAGSGQPE